MKYCIEKGRRAKKIVCLGAAFFSFAVIVSGIFQIMPAAETSANSRCILGISKQADKTSANVGDIVIFTLTFFNSGNADCTGVGVKIRDIVDSNITFLSETHSDNVAPGYGDNPLYDSLRRELVWNANILNPEETGWVSWRGTVNEITPCGNLNISNSASITSEEYSNFGDAVNSNEVVISINNPCPTPEPEPIPDFPLCPLQGNGDIAHYNTGFHQIVGDGLVLGRDDVYSIGNSNYVQCFCPEGGGMGVQTNWYRTDNQVSGWYYENGSQWNLGDYNYSAQNIDYNCSVLTPTPTPTPTSTVTLTPTATPTPTLTPTPTPTATPTTSSTGGGCAGSCGVVFLPPEPRIYVVKTPNTDILPPGGGEIIYSYQIYNPGSSFLTDVNLTDDKCAPIEFLGGDASMDKRLDRGEIWKYSCRTVLKETTVNTATATGKFGTRILTEKAKATVTVGGSGVTDNSGTINFVKKAIPPELPFDGGLVNYVYTVGNPMSAPLTDVGINDDKCSPVNYAEGDVNKDNKLDVQETWTYLCRTTITSNTSNAATVNAKYGNKIITGRAYATVIVAPSPPVIPKHFPKTGQGNNYVLPWYIGFAIVLFSSIKIILKAWRKYNV